MGDKRLRKAERGNKLSEAVGQLTAAVDVARRGRFGDGRGGGGVKIAYS